MNLKTSSFHLIIKEHELSRSTSDPKAKTKEEHPKDKGRVTPAVVRERKSQIEA